MKVLHIVREAASGSGARLVHERLLQQGEESELWSFSPAFGQGGVQRLPLQNGRACLDERAVQILLQGRSMEEIDVVWLHGLELETVPEVLPLLGRAGRFLWSLESCGAYTAGCSHSMHCSQWEESDQRCAKCPLYEGNPVLQEQQAGLLRRKQAFFASGRVELLCQNDFQLAQVQRSIAAGQPAVVLPEPCDMEIFYPEERREARRALGLPEQSFVMVVPLEFSGGHDAVAAFLQKSFAGLQQSDLEKPWILAVFGDGLEPGQIGPVLVRRIRSHEAVLRAAYYRAADVQLYLPGAMLDYRRVWEAACCALPSAVFALGAAAKGQAGMGEPAFQLPQLDEAELRKHLLQWQRKPQDFLRVRVRLMNQSRAGQAMAWNPETDNLVAFCQKKLPELPRQSMSELFSAGPELMQSFFQRIFVLWQPLPADNAAAIQSKACACGMAVDLICMQWLRSIDPAEPEAVWRMLRVWLVVRKLAVDMKFMTTEQMNAHLLFCKELRAFLVQYFQRVPRETFVKLPQECTNTICLLWNFLFLNTRAVLYRSAQDELVCPGELLQSSAPDYARYFLWSMFVPFVPETLDVSLHRSMFDARLPMSLRIVMAGWLITAPLFESSPDLQRQVLRAVREFSSVLEAKPTMFSDMLKLSVQDRMVLSLWRLSYSSENTLPALRAFGGCLQRMTAVTCPGFSAVLQPRKRKPGEKIRIGYVSTNFRVQAVSLYMGNRLRYHDRDRFFVKSFYLESTPPDKMTERIREWSDEFVRVPEADLHRADGLARVARMVKESQLDLLVYADIGMNLLTYQLGAMRLAPVQAVLVGHGTSTGLTTLDYYVSGDHEADDAQSHYTEELVRLPHAGAAQLPPVQNNHKLTRSQFGIPEDAVLFISCANGLKHPASRDALFVELLQRAPKAYVLLKPFISPAMVDARLQSRMESAAAAAGVADRFKVIGPLQDAGDLMALLQLADVQLDTYPYGGWTTNLEALYYGLPVVTQQGNLARSRWGAGLLSAMGISEGIAQNEREFVDWAVRFALEPRLRAQVSQKIEERAPKVLFDGEAAQPAYEAALVRMILAKEKKLQREVNA